LTTKINGYFDQLSEAAQQPYTKAKWKNAKTPINDWGAPPPLPVRIIETKAEFEKSILKKRERHTNLSGEWIGEKALGVGGFGKVGLWLQKDDKDNTVDVSRHHLDTSSLTNLLSYH